MDKVKIANIVQEIKKLFPMVLELVPPEKNYLLKDLSLSCMFLASFVARVYDEDKPEKDKIMTGDLPILLDEAARKDMEGRN